MNEEIVAFPNEAFYNSDLETADQCRDWTIDDLDPITGIDIDGEEQQETYGSSLYNSQEAQAAARQVQLLVQRGLHPTDIGIISAYSGQVETRSRLSLSMCHYNILRLQIVSDTTKL